MQPTRPPTARLVTRRLYHPSLPSLARPSLARPSLARHGPLWRPCTPIRMHMGQQRHPLPFPLPPFSHWRDPPWRAMDPGPFGDHVLRLECIWGRAPTRIITLCSAVASILNVMHWSTVRMCGKVSSLTALDIALSMTWKHYESVVFTNSECRQTTLSTVCRDTRPLNCCRHSGDVGSSRMRIDALRQ